jgi:uncharacterized membrane protein
MGGLKTERAIEGQSAKMDRPLRASSEKLNIGQTQITAMYSGPIPPPDHLAMYEKMVPGIAKQFLEEPHREAEHRRRLETQLVEAQIKLANKGQILAFILASVTVFASFSLIYFGHNLEGLGTLLLSVGAFVSIFIYGKHKSGRA